jgi:type II secretory pathway pseudopilin PulG
MSKLKQIKGKIVSTKGSALMEVLVSIFIISSGLVAAGALVSMSIRANNLNANSIVARHLALEGIEAVRNIRDTNWLIWGNSKHRECWNFWPDTNEDGLIDENDDPCLAINGQNNHPLGLDQDNKLISNYLVDFDQTNFHFVLIAEDNELGRYKELYLDANGLYTHRQENARKTPFQRLVTIKYLDNLDDSVDPQTYHFPEETVSEINCHQQTDGKPGNCARDNRILVESRVSWIENGQEQEVLLTQPLTDYLERENWYE